jgi:protein-L-isoaspartate(D-aspartate) O-methyltransferase
MTKARKRPRFRRLDPPHDPAGLRAALVGELLAEGAITSPAVERAFRRVPRHLFTPGIDPAAAYANMVVLLKRDRDGTPISSVSAPDMQAVMLEQLDVRPGMRVLEIGSGGYNAALLAELVADDPTPASVTTIDIDPEVAARARRCLDAAGYPRVRVVLGDAEGGLPASAPYDRVIVTAEAWDVPPAWVGQLAPGGRIVLPLRLRTLTRSVAFDRVGDHLVSRSSELCGFVRMRGAGRHSDASVFLLDGEIRIDLDEFPADAADPDGLAEVLEAALLTPRAEAWSGVVVGRREPWDSLSLWLATVYEDFGAVGVNVELTTRLVEPALRVDNPAVLGPGHDGFAYLAVRPFGEDGASVEFGAHAYGPDADAMAAGFAGRIAVWDRELRRGPGPTISVWPVGTPMPDADRVIAKKHVKVALDWPRGPDIR